MSKKQADWAALVNRTGKAVMHISALMEGVRESDYEITEVRLRSTGDGSGYVLAIIKAQSAQGPVIAFHKDVDFSEALTVLAERLQGGNLKWREDVPYQHRLGSE